MWSFILSSLQIRLSRCLYTSFSERTSLSRDKRTDSNRASSCRGSSTTRLSRPNSRSIIPRQRSTPLQSLVTTRPKTTEKEKKRKRTLTILGLPLLRKRILRCWPVNKNQVLAALSKREGTLLINLRVLFLSSIAPTSSETWTIDKRILSIY